MGKHEMEYRKRAITKPLVGFFYKQNSSARNKNTDFSDTKLHNNSKTDENFFIYREISQRKTQ